MLSRYDLQSRLPTAVLHHLQSGRGGMIAESAQLDAPCWRKTQNVVIANLPIALQAALIKAQQLGYRSRITSASIHGEERTVAQQIALLAKDELRQMQTGERRCLLSGGETTVTVHGSGRGGRNQELALAFVIEVAYLNGVTLLSAGTDGTDGPNDAAGAQVDGETLSRATTLDAPQYLSNNDSYGYFQLADEISGGHAHLKTGATDTNVMNMQILLLQK